MGEEEVCYTNSATVEGDDGIMVITSSFDFEDTSDPADIQALMDFYEENTCIGEGRPEAGEEVLEFCTQYSDLVCNLTDPELGFTTNTACYLWNLIDMGEPFNSTLFIPTDEAFANLDALIDLNSMMTDMGMMDMASMMEMGMNMSMMDDAMMDMGMMDDAMMDMSMMEDNAFLDIFFYHGTDESLLYLNLQCMEAVEMWNGELSRTKCVRSEDMTEVKHQKGGGNRKNDILPKIIAADLLTCGGNIIHIIDQVMLPNSFDMY